MATARRSSSRCSTRRSSAQAALDSLRKLAPAPRREEPGHVRGRGRQRAHHACSGSGTGRSPGRRRRRSGSPLSVSAVALVHRVFANFAEAVAEGRGKAQADSLRKMRKRDHGPAGSSDGREESVAGVRACARATPSSCEAGQLIPGDGEVIEGIASVDESAITGESAPVIRESGGDRSAVTGGTKVLSDRIVVRITANPGESFLDRMIAPRRGRGAAEDAQRDRAAHPARRAHAHLPLRLRDAGAARALLGRARSRATAIVALLVCLIPTTIGGLLSAIGIAGMDRLLRKNVIAMSGRAVEAAGDVDTLLLDKTGTITLGNRMATEFLPAPGVQGGGPRRRRAAREPRRRDAGGPLHRRAGQGALRPARARGSRAREHALRPVHRPDAHERLRPRRPRSIRKGAVDAIAQHVAVARAAPCRPELSRGGRADRRRGRHAARGLGRRRACSASSTSRTS